MAKTALGRLEQVSLRDTWGNEAADFTPWLAAEANLALLGEALGMVLELVARERGVGRFTADLICKDTTTGRFVLVENQLGKSDHSHLGQVMTYCAGLSGAGEEVRTAVWIAAGFTEEHRATLDWLNEISGDRFQFFGLEIELWRIGESPVAPKFNIVSKPNDWSRDVAEAVIARGARPLSEAQQRQLEYWTAFHAHLKKNSRVLTPQKPQAASWMTLSLGRSGFTLSAVASNFDLLTQAAEDVEHVRAVVDITKEPTDAYYLELVGQRASIEAEFGEPLTWYAPTDYKSRRIFVSTSANLGDRARWPEQHEWLRAKLERLHAVFSKRVKALDPIVG